MPKGLIFLTLGLFLTDTENKIYPKFELKPRGVINTQKSEGASMKRITICAPLFVRFQTLKHGQRKFRQCYVCSSVVAGFQGITARSFQPVKCEMELLRARSKFESLDAYNRRLNCIVIIVRPHSRLDEVSCFGMRPEIPAADAPRLILVMQRTPRRVPRCALKLASAASRHLSALNR